MILNTPSICSGTLARRVAMVILACASLVAGVPNAPAQSEAPIKKKGLIDALRLNGLTTAELIERIAQRGVDFQLTSEDERDLVAVGAKRELIESVRRAYRPPAVVPPTPMPRGAENERPRMVRREPSYDDLIDEAETAIESGDYTSAISRCLKAVDRDETRAAAYQYLAIAELRGRGDYAAGERCMRQAIERGGSAAFRVDHDHLALQGLGSASSMFNSPDNYCSGSLFVSRNGLAFRTDGPRRHEFEIDFTEVKETEKNSYFGKHAAAFNVKSSGTGRTNYNFAPASRDARETDLAIRLIQAFVLVRQNDTRRNSGSSAGKEKPDVDETIELLVGRRWTASDAFLLTRNNDRVPLPTVAPVTLVFERNGKGLSGSYTNANGEIVPLSIAIASPGNVKYKFTDPSNQLRCVSTIEVSSGEIRGETRYRDPQKRGLAITVGDKSYPLDEVIVHWTATPR